MHGWGSRGTPHPLYAPRIRGAGVMGRNPPKNLPSMRTTSIPNFFPIHPAVWISIENKQTPTPTDIALYVLDFPKIFTKSSHLAAFDFYFFAAPRNCEIYISLVKSLKNVSKIMPKRQNFAKSGHTEHNRPHTDVQMSDLVLRWQLLLRRGDIPAAWGRPLWFRKGEYRFGFPDRFCRRTTPARPSRSPEQRAAI